jgi:hypothetical protein
VGQRVPPHREEVIVVLLRLVQRGGVDELDDAALAAVDGRHAMRRVVHSWGVSDWLRGPSYMLAAVNWWSDQCVVTYTPGCQIGYTWDHTAVIN